jgi:hypothetical protein
VSIEALNWALDHMARTDDMSTSTKVVLMLLANRADPETGACYPSVRYIMARSSLGDSTVRAACKELVRRNLLAIELRTKPDGTKTSNTYRMRLETPPPPAIGGYPPTIEGSHPQPLRVEPPMVEGHDTKDLDERMRQTLFADANGAWSEFWKAYPRKTAKQTALKAWRKVKATEIPAVMAALEQHKTSEQWIRGVIPHPATWIHQRRWEDETVRIGADLGQCMWNRDGSRDPTQLRCTGRGTQEDRGIIYCIKHQHLHRNR